MQSPSFPLALAAALIAGCSFDVSGLPGEPEPPTPGAADDPLSEPESDPAPAAVVYRIRELLLRDPHMFVRGRFEECIDITDAGFAPVNARLTESLSGDRDGDGIVDASLLLTVDDDGRVELFHADCSVVDDTDCTPLAERATTVALPRDAEPCGEPLPGSLSGYDPAPTPIDAPCFDTDPFSFTLTVDDPVPHTDVVIAAAVSADGQTLHGRYRGFLSQADADEVLLGEGSRAAAMSGFLPGSDEGCADHDARDTGPNDEVGWYSYFDFTAERVALSSD